jgi:hypothetical protein
MAPQHNPLRKSLAYGAAVIGFAALNAVVLFFATGVILYLRNNMSWQQVVHLVTRQ